MKFRIKDEDGKDYEVEEILEKKSEEDAEEVETVETETFKLSDDEIKALKNLAKRADDILSLLNTNNETSDEEEIESEEEEVIDSDEEVVETCEQKQTYDSKNSFGSLASKKTNVDDSFEEEVSEAWAKRYGGNR